MGSVFEPLRPADATRRSCSVSARTNVPDHRLVMVEPGELYPKCSRPVSSNRWIRGVRVSDGLGDGPAVRLDIWLDVACLFKTRSEAQKAVKNGKIEVNGQPAKPHRLLRAGDELVINRPFGRRQTVVVKTIAEKHVSRAEARQLYDALTPPPTPEEIELRKLERMYRAAVTPPTTPDKRARRTLRKMKEGEE